MKIRIDGMEFEVSSELHSTLNRVFSATGLRFETFLGAEQLIPRGDQIIRRHDSADADVEEQARLDMVANNKNAAANWLKTEVDRVAASRASTGGSRAVHVDGRLADERADEDPHERMKRANQNAVADFRRALGVG